MLQITVPEREYYDSSRQEFITVPEQVLNLEHSLLSLKKWESKWKVPFLGSSEKTFEQSIDYVRCMTLNKNVDPKVYYGITPELYKQINDYIEDPMTATTFSKEEGRGFNKTIITAEIIYFWIVSFRIPFEVQKWHLNSLLALVHVCEIKNSPKKKMKKKDIYSQNRALNEARRKSTGSRG